MQHTWTWGRAAAARGGSLLAVRSSSPAGHHAASLARVERLEHRRLLSAVTSFTLINSETDQPIRTLNDGATLNLAELPAGKLNVRANTDNKGVASVRFRLDGANVNTESSKPYALFGDTGSDYNDGTFALGNHTLRGTPFSRAGGRGSAGTSKTVRFKVVNNPTPPPPPALSRFLLIDADTDLPIGELSDGDEINLAELPTRNINVKAEFAGGGVGSVRFGLDAASNFRVENADPFALFGDQAGGNYRPGTFSVGGHTLRARAFSRDDAQGAAGPQAEISFTVVDEPASEGELIVLFANPADNDGEVNDELEATDDPDTPEDDPGYVIAFVDQNGDPISDFNQFAFANKGPDELELSGPLDVGINSLGLSGGDRTIGIDEGGGDEDGTDELGDIEFQIDDDRNLAFRSEIVGFVKPNPDELSNSPGEDLPVRRYTFVKADDSVATPQPEDFTAFIVLAAPAGDGTLDRVDFTLEQGDTPFQGGGGGRPAPRNRPVRPRGRR